MTAELHVGADSIEGGLPVYEWGKVPDGLVTRRQLRAMNLAPGGHAPVGHVRCRRCLTRPLRVCTRKAGLYDVDLAVPKRTPTLAQEEALDRAMAARQTCPVCKVRYMKCLPLRTLGSCWDCSPDAADLALAQAA
ncbi:hypothetical protein E1265_25820 [Streptomyces sp. 8K308]|uniref:RRQRL motif-containing zinc-binding protein n=1 Tax=Streptomyces sp. 8K308 TaxID=2530388 RepID=UPI00104D985F|nr:RRQRL motif-containing zinc-binding protein [Streptomyces sp. 8K308]TDC17906.1 hypothetical protein E1265_25820 [Streptomyces sp. 8K308]